MAFIYIDEQEVVLVYKIVRKTAARASPWAAVE